MEWRNRAVFAGSIVLVAAVFLSFNFSLSFNDVDSIQHFYD